MDTVEKTVKLKSCRHKEQTGFWSGSSSSEKGHTKHWITIHDSNNTMPYKHHISQKQADSKMLQKHPWKYWKHLKGRAANMDIIHSPWPNKARDVKPAHWTLPPAHRPSHCEPRTYTRIINDAIPPKKKASDVEAAHTCTPKMCMEVKKKFM